MSDQEPGLRPWYVLLHTGTGGYRLLVAVERNADIAIDAAIRWILGIEPNLSIKDYIVYPGEEVTLVGKWE